MKTFWLSKSKKTKIDRRPTHARKPQAIPLRFLVLIGGVFCLLLAGTYYFRSNRLPSLQVETITCHYEEGDCDSVWNERLTFLHGVFLYAPFPANIGGYPATYKRTGTSELEVMVQRPPVLTKVSASTDQEVPFAVTSEGLLLLANPTDPSPVTLIDRRLKESSVDAFIDRNYVSFYNSVLQAVLEKKVESVVKVEIISSSEVYWELANQLLFVSTTNNVDSQLNSLQQLLKNTTIDVKNSVIDLRFNNPVLRPL